MWIEDFDYDQCVAAKVMLNDVLAGLDRFSPEQVGERIRFQLELLNTRQIELKTSEAVQ